MDGKSVICVATNRTIGPLTIGVNSPICQLSVVRPDFESAVLKQQQDRLASPASPVYSSPGPSPSMPPPSPPTAPGPRPQHPSRPPPPEKKFTKIRQKKKKTINYVSEIVPKNYRQIVPKISLEIFHEFALEIVPEIVSPNLLEIVPKMTKT